MNGWLIVNGFVKSEKFNDLYALFLSAAKKRGINLIKKNTIELSFPLGEKITENEKILDNGSAPDFCLFWDKDAVLARRLESEGVRLFNRASAIEACDNKIFTCSTLSGIVKIPKTLTAPKTFEGVGYGEEFAEKATEVLGFPLVLKEAFGSFGKQVYLIKNKAELVKKLNEIGFKDALLQEFISSSNGKDVRINVVGDKVVACMLRYNDGDFRSNISNGGKMQKTEVPVDWKNAALTACHALKLDFAGVDVMFGKDGEPIICEVNSNPHFRSTLTCTGVDMSELIIDHIVKKLG